MNQVGYKGLETLQIGQKLRYVAGKGDYHCEALVEVSQEPGTTGCFAKVLSYSAKGQKIDHSVGDEILAGANELFYL